MQINYYIIMQTILIAADDAIRFLLKQAFKSAQSIRWEKHSKEAVNRVANNHEIDFVLTKIKIQDYSA